MKRFFNKGHNYLFHFITCIILLLSKNNIISQTWTTYTTANTNDQLAGNTINDMALDAQGMVWVATFNGISKFDGTSWIKYQSNLYSNINYSITIDKRGNKWIGSMDGLVKLDSLNNVWTVYNTTGTIPFTKVNDVLTDSIGNVWLGTQSEGIIKFDGNETWQVFTKDDGLFSNIISKIDIDAQGKIWAGSFKGVCKYDGSSWTQYYTWPVRCITHDVLGNLWVGTDKGASKYDGTNWTAYTYNNTNGKLGNGNNPQVNSINFDHLGNMYFGTNIGYSKYDGSTWKKDSTPLINTNLDQVYTIGVEEKNDVWFGTFNGVAKLSSTPLPVEIVSFTGEIDRGKNILTWQTATEKNADYFYVERSVDTKQFDIIGLVKSKGNSITKQTYSYTDDNPLPVSYYRIRSRDRDGHEDFTKIISLLQNPDNVITVFPTITYDDVKVALPPSVSKAEIQIFDIMGRQLLQNNLTQNVENVNLNNFKNGIYLLNIKADGLNKVFKVYKE